MFQLVTFQIGKGMFMKKCKAVLLGVSFLIFGQMQGMEDSFPSMQTTDQPKEVIEYHDKILKPAIRFVFPSVSLDGKSFYSKWAIENFFKNNLVLKQGDIRTHLSKVFYKKKNSVRWKNVEDYREKCVLPGLKTVFRFENIGHPVCFSLKSKESLRRLLRREKMLDYAVESNKNSFEQKMCWKRPVTKQIEHRRQFGY